MSIVAFLGHNCPSSTNGYHEFSSHFQRKICSPLVLPVSFTALVPDTLSIELMRIVTFPQCDGSSPNVTPRALASTAE